MLGIFYVVSLMALVVIGVKISNRILKKFKISRWILAFTAPMVILVPLMVFKNINPWIMNILIIIFSIESIMFFEITKGIMDEKEKNLRKLKK